MEQNNSLTRLQLEEKLKKLELLEERRRIEEGLPHLYGVPHYPWSRKFLDSTDFNQFVVAANQIGKDLEDATEIPTPGGFKRMSDLCVGDEVFAQDGTPTKITAIPYIGKGPGYKVTLKDGSEVTCGAQHEWVCKTSKERFRKTYETKSGKRWNNPDIGKWVTLTTEQIMACGRYTPLAKSPWYKVALPVASEMATPKRDLFSPYLLGLLLGDGSFRDRASITYTTIDAELRDYILACGAVRVSQTITYRLPLEVFKEIRRLGLHQKGSLDKFIPSEYFFGSTEQRLLLLQGLMDTDGTATHKECSSKNVSFSTISPHLAQGVKTLVCSLGGIASITKKKAGYRNKEGDFVKCNDQYQVTIKMKLCPFKLKRKVDLHHGEVRYKHERIIEAIEPVDEISSRCITVEHPSGTFLATRDFVVTHNSTALIRKVIHWATAVDLWPKLFKRQPRVFWYLYPTKDQILSEVESKIIPDWLPRNEYKDHPTYGWKIKYMNKYPYRITFNSGVQIYFKTYAQDVHALQASTVDFVAFDEELPEELYDELSLRRQACDGYLAGVFTATKGQEMWRRAFEEIGKEDETFKDAFKIQISMYDCQFYEDGSPTHWTNAKIERVKNSCKSQVEINRRVYGKFVQDAGLKYPSFKRELNIKSPLPIPHDWVYYSGVDIGSGGEGHPAAIVFVAVSPDYRKARVFKGWRGAKGVETANSDVLEQHTMMRGNLKPRGQYYDYHAKDFQIIAARRGESFIRAEKLHDVGVPMVNVLFKNDMMSIDDIPELEGLVTELTTLREDTAKRHARDDFTDALRYAISKIPWDWTAIKSEALDNLTLLNKPVIKLKTEIDLRMEQWNGSKEREGYQSIDEEIEEWTALMDGQ